MTINAYPLQWPAGWKRSSSRESARFHGTTTRYSSNRSDGSTSSWKQKRELTIAEGRTRVLAELERMGLAFDDVVISTNLPLRLDGQPRGDARNPDDPGVAVYWEERRGGQTTHRVMAVDRYDRVADNLAALAATLDAMRAIERHGGAVILERAFTGFTALPPPGGSAAARGWREVLGVTTPTVTPEMLKARFRLAASQAHPDRDGGSDSAMAAVNLAYEQAKQELGYA